MVKSPDDKDSKHIKTQCSRNDTQESMKKQQRRNQSANERSWCGNLPSAPFYSTTYVTSRLLYLRLNIFMSQNKQRNNQIADPPQGEHHSNKPNK